MSVVGVADTHTALWYLYADPRLSASAKAFIDRAIALRQNIAISSITLVEVIYLMEKGRVLPSAYSDLMDAIASPLHAFQEEVVDSGIARVMSQIGRDEVPDMPDRIVAATGLHLNVPVISRDRKIRAAQISSIW